MSSKFATQWVAACVIVAILFGGGAFRHFERDHALASPGSPTTPKTLFLPVINSGYPWHSPFGIEAANSLLPNSPLLQRAEGLEIQWARRNNRISWRNLQANEGDPIDWSKLASFENELRGLKAAGITPVVIVNDYPRWATIKPSSCSPIRQDKLGAFASFMAALVGHFSMEEFSVHNWEMGNEPDVDPDIVEIDSKFGCWGDIDDPFYGGRYYGEMLKVVTPAMRAVDPIVKVWTGGLLLDRPETTNPAYGRPELFLKGILEAGAAPYFDVIPYHWYPGFSNKKVDYDNANGGPWVSWGGGTLGKARFLRQLMAPYGVDKPLYLNETGLICAEYSPFCNPPPPLFYEMQATQLVRTFVRGMSEDIMGYTWYTLDGPGWRYTGLLDAQYNPRPAYNAFKVLTQQLNFSHFSGPVDFGTEIEAYAFQKSDRQVIVVWAKTDQSLVITVPASALIQAVDRYGNPVTPVLAGPDYQFTIGFDPIYLQLIP